MRGPFAVWLKIAGLFAVIYYDILHNTRIVLQMTNATADAFARHRGTLFSIRALFILYIQYMKYNTLMVCSSTFATTLYRRSVHFFIIISNLAVGLFGSVPGPDTVSSVARRRRGWGRGRWLDDHNIGH